MFSTASRASVRILLPPLSRAGCVKHASRNLHSGTAASQLWTRQRTIAGTGALTIFGGFLAYQVLNQPTLKLDATPSVVEKKVKPGARQEQFVQFWDRPGVFLWGTNSGRVAAPDSDESFVKAPRRVSFFDGYVLKDLQISQNVGVAVTENGELLQWGTGYSPECREPVVVMSGKNIVKAGLSEDRVIALSSTGTVYSIPFSKEEQELFAKPTEMSGSLFPSSSESKISYRIITPNVGSWEKVVDIAVGFEHTVMLTSNGRVFTAASASYSFPDKGQLGVAGMSWDSKPKPYDKPQEVVDLGKIKVTQIAAGNYHSAAADKDGNIYVWGDNAKGQLGLEYREDGYPTPTILPPKAFYKAGVKAKLQRIYAGGFNTYFSMEAEIPDADFRKPAVKTFDVFACGHGVVGSLGTGFWVHAQSSPQKVKNISGLTEYSDAKKAIVPINISYMTVGGTHTAAIMSNLANAGAGNTKETNINFGNDILFFGGNEFYQLGNGKRANTNVPVNIPAMEFVGGKRTEDRFQVVPEKKVRIVDQNSKQRSVKIEQRVVAGRGLTGCYARAC